MAVFSPIENNNCKTFDISYLKLFFNHGEIFLTFFAKLKI